MCDGMYTAKRFRILCGISVLFGLSGWIFITVAVATNKWVIAEGTIKENTTKEGENITQTILVITSTGIWDLCYEEFVLTGSEGERF